MRILFSTGSSARYMAPPQLSDQQVNCGPDWLDRDIGGHVTSLSTPTGEFDLSAVAARLPEEQQPDAVVCLVDASWRALPRNLRAFRCPKILLVADTHHLTAPLTGMIRYAKSEPFDRIVFLYDRHHWEFFHAAGLRQLYWFPGLTLPHGDAAIRAARLADDRRIGQLAFVGQTGICHPRRIQMLSNLNAHSVPLAVKAVSQRESVGFYGSSLVGFNASLNGDLNLRVFEIMASGAMLLTDRLAKGSGLEDLWQDGRELLTYGSPDEMVERARHAIGNPAEARKIGERGAQWIDTHFSEDVRRRDFQKLVFEGVAPTHFQLPTSHTFSVGSAEAGVQARLTAGFEYVQELHRNLDRVVVVLDDSVPDGFTHMCATLPRVDLRRGPIGIAGRADFMAIGRANFASPSLVMAAHVWAWDGGENDRVALVRRCASMGLMRTDSTQLIFCRNRVNTHANQGAIALVRMEQGGYDDALKLAQAELAKNPKSVDAHIVIVELAQESGNVAAGQPALAQLRTLAPNHPRLREILSTTPELLNHRRANRLVRTAGALFEEKKWLDAETLARAALKSDSKSAEAHFLLGQIGALGANGGSSCGHFAQATLLAPDEGKYWFSWGQALRKVAGRELDALAAFVRAADLSPSLVDHQLALAEAALMTGHGALAVQALEAVEQTWPGHSLAAKWLVRARVLVRESAYDQPRDLLLSHVEVTRLQGTGVLLGRFFPNSKNFVTVRSRTLYKGSVDFEGVQFSLDLPGISDEARESVLRRLLAPYRINRILCVPFFASDFVHALTARAVTGASLCTYVMDDQVLHARAVPDDLAQKLFTASDLRLAISAEMIAEYSAWFRCSFDLLPPIVTNRDHEMPNTWEAASGSPKHCAMVGNIWSGKQFEQVRAFTRAAGLKVDWFGNANVAWLPKDHAAMEKDGIFCRGFLTEDQLAARLSAYPFVLLPSGALDGTEDNEWLTRLSLPSRIVFIVTKTFTPMLVLGHVKTAAAKFVEHFGLGTSSNYNSDEAAAKIEWVTEAGNRERLMANARQLSPSFLMPDCGEWLWRSLAAKRCEPAPFDRLYPNVGLDLTTGDDQPKATRSSEVDAPPADDSQSFSQSLATIVSKLSDQAFLDSYLPKDEPRQRVGADLRGAVKYLHEALAAFGPLKTQLLATERLALAVPNNRAVLVAWAELLESDGNLAEAAIKARKALSYFYDDVYTQTLFMRCVGDVNHHADASDRFCSHPFDNFEIYKDGAVFPCNCTQVPFPIGNVYKQSATEIWQSPQAQAIRQSILDGSFRYCSPTTCFKRFNLPKRSEHPEEFARLQRIGVSGTKKPKELNLSYDLSCNLSCPSCRNGKVMATADERLKLDHVRDNIVLPLLAEKDAQVVYITGSGDAFGSPHFRGILKQLCDPKFEHVRITLGTNGQLLTPRLWEELAPLHPRFRDITISIDGATPESYERHRRGSTWEKLQLSMGILRDARKSRAISRLMVNMVVQQDNFMEMRPLLAMCKAWAVDGVRFYRIRQWGNVVPGAFMNSDIANPLHPDHPKLLEELAHPLFGDAIVDHYDMFELIQRAQRMSSSAAAMAALPSGRDTRVDSSQPLVPKVTASASAVVSSPQPSNANVYRLRLDRAFQIRDAAGAVGVMRDALIDPMISREDERLEIIQLACSVAAGAPAAASQLRAAHETQTCLLLYQPWFGFDYARLLKSASVRGVFMPVFAGKRARGERRLPDLNAENFRTYVHRDVPLWTVCQYYLSLQFGSMPETLRVDTPEALARVHDQYVYATELIDEAYDFIRCFRPDTMVLAQGYFTDAAVMRYIGILSGLRVVSLEITLHRERLLWEDIAGAAVNTHLAKNFYWRYRSFVSDAVAIESTRRYLATIRRHKSAEHSAPETALPVLSGDQLRTIVYLGQVSTDAAVLYGRRGFESQTAAICSAAEYAAKNSLRLIVKLHPKESPAYRDPLPYYKNLTRGLLDADASFQRAKTRLGERLIVDSENELDTYALIRLADVCVTHNSQAGLEALLHDKEVILCGEAYFGGLGFTHEANDSVSLHRELDRVLLDGHRMNDGLRCRRFFHVFNELYCLPKNEETIAKLAVGRPPFLLPPQMTVPATCAAPTDTLVSFKNRHQGQRCFVVGGAPSLKQMDLSILEGETLFTVNRGYQARALGLPKDTYHVVSDPQTYQAYSAEIRGADVGQRFYRSDVCELSEFKDAPKRESVITIQFHANPTMNDGYFSEDASMGIYRGFTVVLDAVQLAFMMGFTEVYIIGCDLDYSGEKTHAYSTGAYESKRRNDMPIDRVKEAMAVAERVFRQHGRVLANAGVGGQLNTIPRVDLSTLFPEKRPAYDLVNNAA